MDSAELANPDRGLIAACIFSEIVIAVLAGSLILPRLPLKRPRGRTWSFLIGVILYTLLTAAPYLGWLVSVITTFLGLDAFWVVFTSLRLRSLSSAAPSPAAAG